MLYVLLTLTVLVVGMGAWVRFGPSSSTDDHCSSVDAQLDRQAELLLARSGGQVPWSPPRQRTASRVAARALAHHPSGELLAG